jgi:iron complex outermembrane receptor protein/outer membrane receptor for ferrienterochelin and colicins
MYKPDRVITMRLGAGLGYKTPSLFNSEVDERDYHYLQGYFTGIKAERSFGANFDINFRKKLGEWEITLNQTLFYNNVSDPILLRSGPPYTKLPFSKYANASGDLSSAGSETYVQLHKEALEIYVGYVYTHATRNYDQVTPDLPLIARHKFATVLAYEFSSRFRAGVESAYTGAQFLNDGSKTQPYLFTAVMVRYSFGKLSAVLNCENLFDYRQNRTSSVVIAPYTNPSFKEIWAPIDGRVINLSLYLKLK